MMVVYVCLDKTWFLIQTDIHCTNFLTLNSVQVERESLHYFQPKIYKHPVILNMKSTLIIL